MTSNTYKIYGMTLKDWKVLGKLLNPPKTDFSSVPTVKEYLTQHPEICTEERISKKGVHLIKVFYPTGISKEYELSRIDNTTAFEY